MYSSQNIKGINIGGWFMMEGYILGGRNIPEVEFKERFKNCYGQESLREFENLFRNNFIREEDFKNIASTGANAVRVPFSYKLIEAMPGVYEKDGLDYLERMLSWAEKFKLGVILDLHSACGSQNIDWHSDSRGEALFWQKKEYQKRTYGLWERLATRFREKGALLGYDILNEPVPAQAQRSSKSLKKFYKNVIRIIRSIDRKHFIFLEGDNYGQRIDFLKDLIQEGIVISIHTYQPVNFTFNFTPSFRFPGKIDGDLWNGLTIYRSLEPYWRFAKKNKVRIFVGEFGINWRAGRRGELNWLRNILKAFEDFDFDYAYWTYKAVANRVYPDGLYQYIQNSQYIKREGPIYGWENYFLFWGREKKKIVDFWRTKNFTPNTKLISTLKRFFKNN